MTFGRIIVVLLVLFSIVAGALLMFPQATLSWILPEAAVAEAAGIDSLFRLMLAVSAGLYILIQGLLLYFVWIYRRRSTDDEDAVGYALHGDNRLEIAWTVAPTIFIVILTILSLRELEALRLDAPAAANGAVVQVTGQQFFWTFAYPETGVSDIGTLTLQEGVPVTLELTSSDVMHAFWVPEFRIKQDATPGVVRRITLTPTKTGQYPLRCAELCGSGHSAMLATVDVLDTAAYEAWEAEKVAALEAAAAVPTPGPDGTAGPDEPAPEETLTPEELAALGLELYTSKGCGGCHILSEAGTVGAVGPTHDGLGTTADERIEEAGYAGTATSAEAYIRESIVNPSAYLVEGYQGVMPAFTTLTPTELNALVQLLLAQD